MKRIGSLLGKTYHSRSILISFGDIATGISEVCTADVLNKLHYKVASHIPSSLYMYCRAVLIANP